ncbi:hypothetical protein BDY21DRAFT_57598 [Lineolata rhizophorae]|uniref:Uncharacterized protein n=1 Tax=Lineolata rhizophorae TaxID=578093 RepID=A0A6A6NWP7_9PEZI|nr:hypothetical protein BDY21DRAFT_57598 [Lineolata rhizophorae]
MQSETKEGLNPVMHQIAEATNNTKRKAVAVRPTLGPWWLVDQYIEPSNSPEAHQQEKSSGILLGHIDARVTYGVRLCVETGDWRENKDWNVPKRPQSRPSVSPTSYQRGQALCLLRCATHDRPHGAGQAMTSSGSSQSAARRWGSARAMPRSGRQMGPLAQPGCGTPVLKRRTCLMVQHLNFHERRRGRRAR